MEINRKEILRYLGYAGGQADDKVNAIVEESIEELFEKVSMRSVSRVFSLNWPKETDIEFAGIYVQSKNLSKNLDGCSKILVFAATLGVNADLLLKKYSKTQMSKAVVIQAAAAAMIEQYCDNCQEKLRQQMEQEGFYLRPRFSPGYGDFSIEHQKELVHILEGPKKIGLTVTESFVLAPSKSVTAVIGLSNQWQKCHKKGCELCDKIDCQFRRREQYE